MQAKEYIIPGEILQRPPPLFLPANLFVLCIVNSLEKEVFLELDSRFCIVFSVPKSSRSGLKRSLIAMYVLFSSFDESKPLQSSVLLWYIL